MKRKLKKIFFYTLIVFTSMILIIFICEKWVWRLSPPEVKDFSALQRERTTVSPDFYVLGNSWLRKNSVGLWEMYVEGDPFTMGVINGKLTKELINYQENVFVNQIQTLIPSKFYQKFLNVFVSFFNRKLDSHIPKEYLTEIYGISFSASHAYDRYGSPYHRILNYHAAHDMGHALQNLHMVGCTSFSVWNDKSENGNLLIGRNFDFYFGDDFSKNKIIGFYNPSKGYKFMTVAWGGMAGAVSGMNDQGLTVTMNAANSDVPLGAKTPITLVTREILQYAANIEQAYAIACKRETFVSESLMIGSAADNKTVIIEKDPKQTGLFETNTNYIVCTNHFQDKITGSSPKNRKFMRQSSTVYRYRRVEELLQRKSRLSVTDFATLLRNRNGMHDKPIGMGNEKAINQLIAHHSIIFEPAKLRVWVSSNPWQLGKYICYDLSKIFTERRGMKQNREVCEKSFNIPEDPFLQSEDYKNFVFYKKTLTDITNYIYFGTGKEPITLDLQKFEKSNPYYFQTYATLADYYFKKKMYTSAYRYCTLALVCEIPAISERTKIKNTALACLKKFR